MDLALHLGCGSLKELKSRMSEREFVKWNLYSEKYMLPQRRLELYLAQIALLIAKTMGGMEGAKLQDFLFDPPEIVSLEDALKNDMEMLEFDPK